MRAFFALFFIAFAVAACAGGAWLSYQGMAEMIQSEHPHWFAACASFVAGIAVALAGVTMLSKVFQGGPRRWYRERLDPSLTCARLGHFMVQKRQPVLLKDDPDSSSIFRTYVAVEAEEITPTCARCGHKEKMRLESKRYLTGLTLPSDRMRALDRDGRIEQ